MTAVSTQSKPVRERSSNSYLALVAAMVAVVVAFIAGVLVQGGRGNDAEWRTGQTTMMSKQMSIQIDDWTYGVVGAVPMWVDASGSWHEGGWPNCLTVPAGTEMSVRFASLEVSIDVLTTRPILAIDCQGTGPI